MNIRDTFINLTRTTHPYGTEYQLINHLPEGLTKDKWGNYYMKIGKSKTIFACHLDNACKTQSQVTHVFDGKLIKTDGTSILGADDKAGLTVILNLIHHKIPGLYYFFIGEEVGCIGSGNASKNIDMFKNYERIICFDRKNLQSIITHQSLERTCSDAFANSLITEFQRLGMTYVKDNGGVYTDSAEFKNIIPECTNISVGYYDEHTINERQDIDHLIKLSIAATKINWEKLKTNRNPNIREISSYNHRNNCGYEHEYDEIYDTQHRHNRRGGKKNYNWNKNKKDENSFPEFKSVKENRDLTNYYEIKKEEYLNPKLTEKEAKIIIDLCLDPTKEDEKEVISYLVDQIKDSSEIETCPF